MTFSHLPPVRLSCIRSLVVPTSTGHCLHLDSKEPNCEGNRLYILSKSPLRVRIKLPHHKNARQWGKAVIVFDLPSDLAKLVHTYVEAPRKLEVLLDHHLLIGVTCPYVLNFMDMHGRGFRDAAVLTLYWQKWLVSRGGVPVNPLHVQESVCRWAAVQQCCSWPIQSRSCYSHGSQHQAMGQVVLSGMTCSTILGWHRMLWMACSLEGQQHCSHTQQHSLALWACLGVSI